MKKEFDIQALWRLTQPFTAPPFLPVPGFDAVKDAILNKDADPYELVSQERIDGRRIPTFVRPSFAPVKFKHKLFSQAYETDTIELPFEPLVTAKRRKVRVLTYPAGSEVKGSVKETAYMSDWEIRLEGMCVSEDQKTYPAEQVELLNYLMNFKPEKIEMQSRITAILGIERIVIDDVQFLPKAGFPGVQRYRMDLKSDFDFTLIKQ